MIKENLQKIKSKIPKGVKLVAVTKTKPIADIMEAYNAGQRDFGENKVQEMERKAAALPKDIRWHMIGHVQRNKVKYMAGFVNLIHGVDSFKLLKEINKQAAKHDRVINCLLQAHIAQESTKFGLDFNEIDTLIKSKELADLKHIKIIGLMGMATFTDDEAQVIKEFHSLRDFYESMKECTSANVNMKILSMGMSGDYELAIQEGSNMVRIGTAIFGNRNYIA